MLIDHLTYISYTCIALKEIYNEKTILSINMANITMLLNEVCYSTNQTNKLRTKSVTQQFCLYFSLDMFLFLCIWNVYVNDITFSSLCALSPKHSGKLYDNQITSVDT